MVNNYFKRPQLTEDQDAYLNRAYNQYLSYRVIADTLIRKWPELEEYDMNREYIKDYCYKRVKMGKWKRRQRSLSKAGTANYEHFKTDVHPFANRIALPEVSPLQKAKNILDNRFKEKMWRGQPTYFLDGRPCNSNDLLKEAGVKI